jgi:spore maturation protein CgeB
VSDLLAQPFLEKILVVFREMQAAVLINEVSQKTKFLIGHRDVRRKIEH